MPNVTTASADVIGLVNVLDMYKHPIHSFTPFVIHQFLYSVL